MGYILMNREYGYGDHCICKFICDTLLDLRDLPTDCCAGSTAVIVSTGKTYMINTQGEWQKQW